MGEVRPDDVQRQQALGPAMSAEAMRSVQPQSGEWDSDNPGSTGGRGATEPLVDELIELRECVEFLRVRRGQDEAALRAAVLQWSDQVAQLRTQVDRLENRTDDYRSDMEQLLTLVQRHMSGVGRMEREVERHQQIIHRLSEENVYGAANLRRMNEEQIQALNQVMSRISGLQAEIARQRQRLRKMFIAVGVATLAVALLSIMFLGWFGFR